MKISWNLPTGVISRLYVNNKVIAGMNGANLQGSAEVRVGDVVKIRISKQEKIITIPSNEGQCDVIYRSPSDNKDYKGTCSWSK